MLLLGAGGCSTYHDGPPVYSSTYYHYPYRYHYYPDSRVYFHITSGHYYYRDGDHWRRTRQLPHHHHLDHRDRVRLWIDTDKPYQRNKQHRERYHRDAPRRQREPAHDHAERKFNQRKHESYRRWER